MSKIFFGLSGSQITHRAGITLGLSLLAAALATAVLIWQVSIADDIAAVTPCVEDPRSEACEKSNDQRTFSLTQRQLCERVRKSESYVVIDGQRHRVTCLLASD